MKKLLFIVNPRRVRPSPAPPCSMRWPLFPAPAIWCGSLSRRPAATPPRGGGVGPRLRYGGLRRRRRHSERNDLRPDDAAAAPAAGLPANGSTNDFAASLHLSSDPRLAALDIAGGKPHPLDIGRHNDRYFAYVASFGAFTRSSYSASQAAKNALGHFAYILEGLGDLDSLRPYSCRIEADGEVFEGDFIFGAVCNCTSMGGLVKLDPSRVKMDDGRFELLLLRMPKSALDLQNLITAMTRMQYDYPGVIFRHVQHVTLTTQTHIPWSLDGEYAPSAARVDIENLPGAVSLLR